MTREELYELIWADPVYLVAKRLKISGTYLARVCIALEVPRPPRGYWAKKAVGKAPVPPELPPVHPGNPDSWDRGATEQVCMRPFYTKLYRECAYGVDETKEHPLIRITRQHYEAAVSLLEGRDGYLQVAQVRPLVDLTVSSGGLQSALKFADTLFMTLNARSHRVVIAALFQKLMRVPIIVESELSTDEPLEVGRVAAPYRPTLTYIGATLIGLSIVETSKLTRVQYAGFGKFVAIDRWKDRKVGHSWSTTKQMPTGLFKLVAYDPTLATKWKLEWSETKPGQLTENVKAVVEKLERAAVDLESKS